MIFIFQKVSILIVIFSHNPTTVPFYLLQNITELLLYVSMLFIQLEYTVLTSISWKLSLESKMGNICRGGVGEETERTTHTISVKTGDKKWAGTDGNVSIHVHIQHVYKK